MATDPNALANKLGVRFGNTQLLQQALTHSSAGRENYERLEFLGDSILNFVIAEALYARFPEQTEGVLSRLRAGLVNRQTLAKLARDLDLGDYLVLGAGERKSGGHNRDSILSDVFESLIGAAYRESGMDAAKEFILRQYRDRLAQCDPDVELKDPKTRLQELLQKRKLSLPSYEITSVEGADHEQTFFVQCRIAEFEKIFHGHGNSRRIAEQEAATQALAVISG